MSSVLISLLTPLAQAMEQSKTYITRNQFFKDITNLDEDTFRKNYGWDTKTKQLRDFSPDSLQWLKTPPLQRPQMPNSLKSWIDEYPRRAAIFAGTVGMFSLKEINTVLKRRGSFTLGKPRFMVQLHDPNNTTLTDVRTLVALPENKNAGFQVASTFFGMLEGGMDNPREELTNMLKGAAQGEEISIATAPATIYRKYFYTQPYLLKYLGNKAKVFINKKGLPSININSALEYQYDINDMQQVSIGLHQGAVVSNGPAEDPFKKPEPTDRQLQLPIAVQPNGLIDQNKTQTVNLLFTAAYSIRNREDLALNDKVRSFCQMLLDASYEATLKDLALTQQPKVFLTLMGAGAFGNPISWVGEALSKKVITNTINNYGLDVTLIYRMDKKPHRTAEKDAQFLLQMFTLADTINGTTNAQDPQLLRDITSYTTALYNDKHSEASAFAQMLMLYQKGNQPKSSLKKEGITQFHQPSYQTSQPQLVVTQPYIEEPKQVVSQPFTLQPTSQVPQQQVPSFSTRGQFQQPSFQTRQPQPFTGGQPSVQAPQQQLPVQQGFGQPSFQTTPPQQFMTQPFMGQPSMQSTKPQPSQGTAQVQQPVFQRGQALQPAYTPQQRATMGLQEIALQQARMKK